MASWPTQSSLLPTLTLLALLGVLTKAVDLGRVPARRGASGDSLWPRGEVTLSFGARSDSLAHHESVIVGLLDGTVESLDIKTGQRLWRFNSGPPLVSSSASSLQPNQHSPLIFPGADGSLYTYLRDETQQGIQKLQVTVPELVELSPSLTADDALLVGKKETTVYAVDRATGSYLKTFSSNEASMLLDPSADDSKTDLLKAGLDAGSVLFVGRDDFTVQSLNMRGGGEQLWNVSYSRLRCMDRNMLFTSSAAPETSSPLGWDELAAGSDGTLRRFDRSTGQEAWMIKFDNHPVAAFVDGKGRNVLLKEPQRENLAKPDANGKRDWLAWPGTETIYRVGNAPRSRVILGQLKGSSSFYVLPMDEMSVVHVPEGDSELSPQAGTGRLPRLPGLPEGDSQPTWDASDPGPGFPSSVDDLVCPTMGMQKLLDRPHHPPAYISMLPSSLRDTEWGSDSSGRAALPGQASRPGAALEHAAIAGAVASVLAMVWLAWMLGRWRSRRPARQDAEQQPPAAELAIAATPSAETETDTSPAHQPRKKNKRRAMGAAEKAAADREGGAAPKEVEGPGVAAMDGPAPLDENDLLEEERSLLADHGSSSLGTEPSLSSGLQREEEASGGSRGDSRVSAASTETAGSGGGGGSRSSMVRQRKEEADGIFTIGRMQVDSKRVLGLGSAGTIVYGGELDGRAVAVKRLLLQFYDLARRELDMLVCSDDHPNIVRCYALEEDREFVYLALELCRSTLAEFVESGGHELVDAINEPTELCMRVARNIAEGIATLHTRGIVHRDLKPANVLMTNDSVPKVSDMGLCKRLLAEQSSFDSAVPGGSSGWQAPEQLMQIFPPSGESPQKNRQTRALDVFSLGCVLYYLFTGGKHPFGQERFVRDGNIVRGSSDLSALSHLPLLQHLISCMLSWVPEERPTMQAVLAHPAWWPAERQVSFLVDLSDRVELEDRELAPSERAFINSLETVAKIAIEGTGDWADMVDQLLLDNLGRFRKYNTRSLRDLLRVVRNKNNHFREMPPSVQELMGPPPQGFLYYFTSRFPRLFLTCWLWALHRCPSDPPLDKYFPDGCTYGWGYTPPPETSLPVLPLAEKGPEPTMAGAATPQQQRRAASSAAAMPSPTTGNGKAGRRGNSSTSNPVAVPPPVTFPYRPGEPLCSFYERTGECKFAKTCRFHHPPFAELGTNHPVRPGERVCEFFLRTGGCVYGSNCMFDHPPERAVQRNAEGYPLRPGHPLCQQLEQYGRCTQGWFCKFDHYAV
mmetsp:Transcript_7719/g.21964  ORF Transcript_7719/g.21964 Transcript_7719/m.21964 type:complete len:1257 (+) Transcript_7719:192-3962(+)